MTPLRLVAAVTLRRRRPIDQSWTVCRKNSHPRWPPSTREVDSILTPSGDFAKLAEHRGYWVIEVGAGTETLYEIRAIGRGITAYT